MARTKQREQYGNGSVAAVTQVKKDAEGRIVYGDDDKPVRVQEKDKSGRPVWRCCVSLGTETYTNSDGALRKRQRKIQKRFAGTLKEARAYCAALVKDYSAIDADQIGGNFSGLVAMWAAKGHKCSEKQQAQYMRHLGYIAPYLDVKPALELKASDIAAALDGIEKSHGLSPATLNKILTVTSRVFEFGINHDCCVRNPCRGVEPREAAAKQKRRALSEAEAARLCRMLDIEEARIYEAFTEKEKRQAEAGNAFGRSALRNLGTLGSVIALRLLLASGARRGEVLGLQWGNVDLQKGSIRIAQTLTETNELKVPKTDYGIRSLKLDKYTLEHLRKWREFQAKCLHLVTVDGVALSQGAKTPVCCTDNGRFIDPTNFQRWWVGFRSSIGFDGLLVHELRHTQITALLGAGVDVNEVQTRVGHSRPSSVTLQYLHELPARDYESARVMGQILYETEVATLFKGAGLVLQKTA